VKAAAEQVPDSAYLAELLGRGDAVYSSRANPGDDDGARWWHFGVGGDPCARNFVALIERRPGP
jgi:hypothetical protein